MGDFMADTRGICVRRRLVGGLLLAWMTWSPPCLARQASHAETVPGAGDAYVIGPEDVLDIAVWNNATLSRVVPVRPDGKISLPLLNDVHAAGLTPTELRDALSKALAPFMAVAEVSVIVREVHSFKVAVIGEVRTPGRYELKSLATVLDVLAMAGGLSDYADRENIVILRRDAGTTKQISFDYTKLTARNGSATRNGANGNGQENVSVRPGDIILVR
jgi:polysaccharide biosynthesis/export protein